MTAGRLAASLALAVLAATTAACTSSSGDSPAGEAQTTITVGAASSLTDVFEQIATDFTEANPDVIITFSFAASSTLAEQIRGGAPLDVFASAGRTAMEPLVAEGLVTGVADFATNALQIATPPGNPAGVTGLADLPNVSVLVCEKQVPCGVAAMELFERNSLAVSPVSFESDVRSVLTKIEADEADAGIVYVTDVIAAGAKVVGIAIPSDANVTSIYQAAVVAESARADAAARFVAFLTGPQAQAALAAAGFDGAS